MDVWALASAVSLWYWCEGWKQKWENKVQPLPSGSS